MQKLKWLLILLTGTIFSSCSDGSKLKNDSNQPVYLDIPYLQDYAVKYNISMMNLTPKKVYCDRNGVIQILASNRLYRPNNGRFQQPGTIEPDITYRPMADKQIQDMILYENQFVYLDSEAVFSNAWAGKLYSGHPMPDATYPQLPDRNLHFCSPMGKN